MRNILCQFLGVAKCGKGIPLYVPQLKTALIGLTTGAAFAHRINKGLRMIDNTQLELVLQPKRPQEARQRRPWPIRLLSRRHDLNAAHAALYADFMGIPAQEVRYDR